MSNPLTFQTLPDIVRHYGIATPHHAALEFKGQRTPYGSLNAQMNGIAATLQSKGVSPGDRVAFLGRNSDLYFLLMYGCAAAGAIFVPLNWRLAAAEIDEILRDCDPRITFYDREFQHCIGDSVTGGQTIEFSLDRVSGQHSISELLQSGTCVRPASVDSEDVAVILYTSGTTGRAKGVQLTHRSLIAPRHAESALGEWTHWVGGQDKLFAAMPLFHIGCLSSTMMAFYHGCMVYLIEQADPDQLLTAIVERKLTQGLVVPTVINALLMSPRIATLDLTSLKIIMYGGSPIAPETLVKAMEVFGCGLAQGYGMTEVAGACIFLAPEDHDPSKPNHLLSIGRPSALAKLDVRDAQGDSLPDGEVGEFWINSVGLMKGYWRRPGEDEVVLRDGWYRSGDAGYRDADGFYYLTDRVKDMIVSGAENVYPAEVERALMQHPSLLEVAVIGIPHEKWGEAAHAIAVLKPGADTSADEILAFTRRLLAGFKVPKSLEFISALPRNAFGKVPKYVLREPFWAGHKRRVG